jgi:hypothetical protein
MEKYKNTKKFYKKSAKHLIFSFFSCNFAKLLQAIACEKQVFQRISFAKACKSTNLP